MVTGLSIIVPVYNEGESVKSFLTQLKSTVTAELDVPFELVVCNDGSSDNSAEEILKTDNVFIDRRINRGYGFTLKEGIANSKFSHCAIIDADGTYSPTDISHLFEYAKIGFPMVVGARDTKKQDSWIKLFFRGVLRRICGFFSGVDIIDPNSGLRIFAKEHYEEVKGLLCNRFSFTTSISIAFALKELPIHYVPIAYDIRSGGISKVSHVRDSFVTFKYIVHVTLLLSPLRIFYSLFFLGILLSITLIGSGIYWQIETFVQLGVLGIIASGIVLSLGFCLAFLNSVLYGRH